MKLITYEIRMAHVKGPEHDWWASGDERVRDSEGLATAQEVARMHRTGRYRNIKVQADPHDSHPASAVDHGMTGMYVDCTVPGCTWSKDYD